MKRKEILVLSYIMLISLFSSASIYFALSEASNQSATQEWTMFRHDLMHTGSTSSPTPTTNQTLWKFNTGGQVGSPTVIDGVVYVGSYDRKVYAFKAADGAQLWSY